MKCLSKKDLLFIGLMLFSLFFGAGNLIFPPFLGQAAGKATWVAMAGFFITAVCFPVLGVIAVAKAGGLNNLAQRVNPLFASIFTVLIYLTIGPCIGIPRAGSLPFEMAVAPYLPESVPTFLALFVFSFTFFTVAYWLSLSPNKLVDRMGKVLTPILLTFILMIVTAAFFKPIGRYGVPTGEYMDAPFIKGFIEGYMTMDTIAALNFGIVIALAIRTKGIYEEKTMISTTIKAGLLAGGLLTTIYCILAHLGASSGGRFGMTENGAQTLTHVMTYLFGRPGAILLAVLFTLACLTTSVGLLTSCSQYFASITKKISYKNWVRVLTLSSMLLANMGLTKILSICGPVLDVIYPIAIMLIVLAMLDRWIKGNVIVYGLTIFVTGMMSTGYVLASLTTGFEFIHKVFGKLPLYEKGLGWIIPAALAMGVGIIIHSRIELNQEIKEVENI